MVYGTTKANEVVAQLDLKLGTDDWQNGEVHPGAAPAAADSVGVAGTIVGEDGFLYYCVSSGVWQRVAIATW